MSDSSITTKKQHIKRYATHLMHKLTTAEKKSSVSRSNINLFNTKSEDILLPALQLDHANSTCNLSDEDEAPTPTDSMMLLNTTDIATMVTPLVMVDHNNNKHNSVPIFDKKHRHQLARSCSYSSLEQQFPTIEQQKEFKAIAMWQSTIQKLIVQKRVDRSMENYMKKKKFTERDEALSRFILNELYTTEKSFYQFLTYIQKTYMEPMLAATVVPHIHNNGTKSNSLAVVKFNDVHVLFNYLPSLINTSRNLLSRLEDIKEQHKPGLAIGGVFKVMEPEFVVFLKYAIHYQAHFKSIRKASTSAFITKINSDKRNGHYRLGISDYLIAPFQRVPRYELLLKDLLKHTDTNDDEVDLIYASNLIRGLAATMNSVQEKITSL